MQRHNNKIEADLLGRIVLSRFLEMPLRALDNWVVKLESSAAFAELRASLVASRLNNTQLLPKPCNSPSILGKFQEEGGNLALFYGRESFMREYLFDDQALAEYTSRNGLSKEQMAILSKSRLVNTRNRLTQALMKTILSSQTEYLRTGNNLSLLPLTQAQVSAKLISAGGLSMVADPGRISRLIRGLSVMLPDDQIVPLSKLFPKTRQIHCHAVSRVIETEKTSMAKEMLADPFSDEIIAAILAKDYGIHVSRRTVVNIRRDLAIPDSRKRGQRMNYLVATAEFSALLPLTLQTLRTQVPAHPGIYEVRLSPSYDRGEEVDENGEEERITPHPVVYIGSTGDLRKRLGDHLRGNSGNIPLYRHIAKGAVRVRFRLIREDWRSVERDLYRVFCETFGSPPLCNRMSP